MKVACTIRASVRARLAAHLSQRLLNSWLRELSDSLELKDRELSILFTDDREIRRLNREYRKKDKATDVLSFPLSQDPNAFPQLGDIVISVPTTIRQAHELEETPRSEFRRLLIHGLLHLLGYDHEHVSAREAERMRRKERQLERLFE